MSVCVCKRLVVKMNGAQVFSAVQISGGAARCARAGAGGKRRAPFGRTGFLQLFHSFSWMPPLLPLLLLLPSLPPSFAAPSIFHLNGLTYNFSSLAASHPRGIAVHDNRAPPWSYHFTVGGDLNGAALFSPTCPGAAPAFQVTGGECFALGAPAAAAPTAVVPLDAGELGVALSYAGGSPCAGDVKRSVRLVFVCAAGGGRVCKATQREAPTCAHTIVLRGELGCPAECPRGGASGRLCAGHGTCTFAQPRAQPPAAGGSPVACACDAGFSGPACEEEGGERGGGAPWRGRATPPPPGGGAGNGIDARGGGSARGWFSAAFASAAAALAAAACRRAGAKQRSLLAALAPAVAIALLLLVVFSDLLPRVPLAPFRPAFREKLGAELGAAAHGAPAPPPPACASSSAAGAGACECLSRIQGCSQPSGDGARAGSDADFIVRDLWLLPHEPGGSGAAAPPIPRAPPPECPLRFQFGGNLSFGLAKAAGSPFLTLGRAADGGALFAAGLICDSPQAAAVFEAAWPRLQPGGVFVVSRMLRNECGATHNALFTPSGYRTATLAETPRDGGIKPLLDALVTWMACRNMAQTDFKDPAGVALARTIRSVDCWRGGACFVRKAAGSAEADVPLSAAEARAQGPATWSSIAAGTRTDKITTHAYQWAYDRYLPRFLEAARRTGSTVRLFEIGLGCGMPWGAGASAPTWLSYFKDVPFELTYLEYDAPCLAQWLEGAGKDKRIVGFAGDQRNATLLARIAAERGPFHIVIDDGGHSMAMQVTSLRALLPALVRGGAYVLEDLQTSLWDRENFMRDGPPYGLGYVLDVAQLVVAGAGPGGEYTADQWAVAAAVRHVDMYAECAVFVAA